MTLVLLAHLLFTNPAFQSKPRCGVSADSLRDSTWLCQVAHRPAPLWADSAAIADSVFGPRSALWAAWWARAKAQAEYVQLSRTPIPHGKLGARDTAAVIAAPWSGTTFYFLRVEGSRGVSCNGNEVPINQ